MSRNPTKSQRKYHVTVYFVVKEYSPDAITKSSEIFQTCFVKWKEHFDITDEFKHVKDEATVMQMTDIGKTTVFVLEKFEGPCFRFLQETQALVLGPMCLTTCILNDISIPSNACPVFTNSMIDMRITASGVSPSQKKEISKLVGYMGGTYLNGLSADVTHLVSCTVTSEKYEKAAARGMQIMHPDWVRDVWDAGQFRAIICDDARFMHHKLPIFYNLKFSSTGLRVEDRAEMKQTIEANGGSYSGSFQSDSTDILLLERDKTDSAKFRSAQSYKKPCLTMEWVRDSVKSGFAVTMEPYKISTMKGSTPTKGDVAAADFAPDCTQLSEISHLEKPDQRFIEESMARATSPEIERKYKKVMDNIDFSKVKRAGPFLDGCKIYLSGFRPDDKEKLIKVLNTGGATRYDDLNEQVTHVIVGEFAASDHATIATKRFAPWILTLDWIVESLRLRELADVDQFKYVLEKKSEPELPSPASKKAIQSLNNSFKRPAAPKFDLGPKSRPSTSKALIPGIAPLDEKENDVLAQYLTANPLTSTEHVYSEPEVSTEDLVNLNFFRGKTVFYHGFEDPDEVEQLADDCRLAKGNVVTDTYTGCVDYVLTPVKVSDLNVPVEYKTIVNDLWLEASIQQNVCVDIEYWHRPVVFPDDCDKPLVGEKICLSTYAGQERMYIIAVAGILGADVVETFMKKAKPTLICPLPEGNKYSAAKKWGLPVLTKDWLLECMRAKQRVGYGAYIVGNTIPSPEVSSINPEIIAPSTSTDQLNSIIDAPSTRSSTTSNTLNEIGFDPKELGREMEKLSQDFIVGMEKRRAELEAFDVPVKQHRRISELRKNSTPNTSPQASTNNISANVMDYGLDTPTREVVKQILYQAEAEKDTPRTKRMKELLATPGTAKPNESLKTPELPSFCKTPGSDYDIGGLGASPNTRRETKRVLDVLDQFYVPPPKRDQLPQDERDEFVRDNLGDLYKSRSEQCGRPQLGITKLLNQFTPKSRRTVSAIEPRTLMQMEDTDPGITNLEDFCKAVEATTSKEILKDTETQVDNDNMIKPFSQPHEVLWMDTEQMARPPTKQRKFIYTSLDEEKKQRLMQRVEELGGINLVPTSDVSTSCFDIKCTHVICEKPTRGEKTMAGLAAGRWILSPTYVEASAKAGTFLNEEPYEWGNPLFKPTIELTEIEASLAAAAYRWRGKIQAGMSGAFSGFRVILHADRKEAFTNIIKAGSGQVLDISPPYHKSADTLRNATHCFIGPRAPELSLEDKRAFQSAKVKIRSINFMNNYLTSIDPDASSLAK